MQALYTTYIKWQTSATSKVSFLFCKLLISSTRTCKKIFEAKYTYNVNVLRIHNVFVLPNPNSCPTEWNMRQSRDMLLSHIIDQDIYQYHINNNFKTSLLTYVTANQCFCLDFFLFFLCCRIFYNIRCFRVLLCCLMTLCLSKDIWCHVWAHPFLCLQITRGSKVGRQPGDCR